MLTHTTEPHHGRLDVGKRFDQRLRLLPGFTCVLLGVLVGAGCSSNRPDALSWSGQWSQQSDAVEGLISTSDSDVSAISGASCEKFVVIGSSAAADLIPAPSTDLDERLQAWANLVGAVGTECTPSATQSQVLNDIESLADDIDALVASEIPTR
jgi:hypothetical protein